MNIKIRKAILLENLLKVEKAISTKNIIPILSGIKFDLTNDGLYLTASDNDITIQTFIDKANIDSIEKCGSIVLQGRYIVEIIRKLPGEFISLVMIDEYKVCITSESSTFNLNAIDPNEFPKTDMEDGNVKIELSKETFKSIINQTAFATSNQETRPLLTGINFKVDGDVLECTATDSYRLAKQVIKLNQVYNEKINIVIPCKNILELMKILKDDENKLQIHIFQNRVLFKFDNVLLQSRLLNGTYPDTSKLIPTDYTLKIEAPLMQLYNVVDRASLLSNDKEKNVIKLVTKENIMTISSNSPEIGRVEEHLNIVKEINNDITIAFSSKYMMDALRALKCEKVIILFSSEVKPIILKNPENDNITQLILPIRTY